MGLHLEHETRVATELVGASLLCAGLPQATSVVGLAVEWFRCSRPSDLGLAAGYLASALNFIVGVAWVLFSRGIAQARRLGFAHMALSLIGFALCHQTGAFPGHFHLVEGQDAPIDLRVSFRL